MKQIYLDNQATTCVDPNVLSEMLPYFSEQYANASSIHNCARGISKTISEKRESIANYIGASGAEVYFTSGATESINLALKGFSEMRDGITILTSNTEHSAVLNCCKKLSKSKDTLLYCPVDRMGVLDFEAFEKTLSTKQVDLVCLMHVNNEIGTIHDIRKVGEMCHQYKTALFVDATQSLGKLPIDVESMHIDFLAASGHKIYGPKGIGLLYVRKTLRFTIAPLFHGGGQEGSLRSGTLNVPGVIGFASALDQCHENSVQDRERIGDLTHHFLAELNRQVHGILLNGSASNRIYGNINIRIEGVSAELLLSKISHVICISTSSSCNSTKNKGSHVLRAIGLNSQEVSSSIRVGIGRFNTKNEIDQAVDVLCKAIRQIRSN